MATKLENYVKMASDTAAEITRSVDNWTGFLNTAANLYRYTFPDQLLIHAQRSNVKACADFDVWTKKMKYYVRRGSRGIVLVNMQSGRPSIRYVFDIADTGRKEDSRNLYFWKYKQEYQDVIIKALEKYFGVACDDKFIAYIGRLATKLVKNYWKDYKQDIMCAAEGSSLEVMDEQSLRVKFCNLASYSIACAILFRCGFHPGNYQGVFQDITDFNTQNIIRILGHVVSEASGDVLHQIAIAIFSYERQKQATTQHNNKPAQANNSTDTKSDNQKQPSSFIITVDNNQSKQPSIKDIYEQYKPIVKDFLLKDTAYKNACKNSDKENAYFEGLEAVKRAAYEIKDLEFLKLFYDLAEFHSHLQQEVLVETYPELSKVQESENTSVEPHPEESKPEQSPASESASADPDQEETLATELEPDTPDAQPAPNSDEASPPQPVTVLDETQVEVIPPSHVVPANYHFDDNHGDSVSAKDKYNFNMYAITMLKKLEAENRAATSKEQAILAHHAGWGGIPDVFNAEKSDWTKEYEELKSILTPEEYESARASVLNAHFTSPVIIKAIGVFQI